MAHVTPIRATPTSTDPGIEGAAPRWCIRSCRKQETEQPIKALPIPDHRGGCGQVTMARVLILLLYESGQPQYRSRLGRKLGASHIRSPMSALHPEGDFLHEHLPSVGDALGGSSVEVEHVYDSDNEPPAEYRPDV